MQKVKLSRSLNLLVLSLSSALVFTHPAVANNSASAYQANVEQAYTEQITSFTEAELEQMLAPIALYPDALLSHILIATTYPIEVIDAERWLNKNNQLGSEAIANAAEYKDWDASIKALLPFPNILKKLSDDLDWMRNLGDAFLQNEAQVLASVQALRLQADQAGNLRNMNNVNVVRESKTIIIESSQPDIIYVPYYDTREVYGDWRWSHYPPVYWHHPVHYVSHHGPYYWHNPVHLTVGLFFGAVHWHNRHVVVNHHKSRYYKHHSKKKTSTSYQAKRWEHNPRHRKGVSYRSANIQKRYPSHSQGVKQHKSLRVNQKQMVDKNPKMTQRDNNRVNSHKSHNLAKKLQVNRAAKADQKNTKKQTLTEYKPKENKSWKQVKDQKQRSSREPKHELLRANKKYDPQQHQGAKSIDKHVRDQQREQVTKHSRSSDKAYTSPVTSAKSTYQTKSRPRSENNAHKRSAPSRQKSHHNRSHKSRAIREH